MNMEKHAIFDEVYKILEQHPGESGMTDGFAGGIPVLADTRTTENGKTYREASFLSAVPLKLSELVSEDHKVEWIWRGLIARGCLTLFYALWKCGKTTLISHLIKALNTGSLFLGLSTQQANVLIISEENKSMWVERRDELGFDCWIMSRPIRQRLQSKEWETFVRRTALFCKEKQIDVVVFDTISAFWGAKDENSAAEVQTALLPLNELLENNIAVFLIHHFRKSAGDEGTAGRGSGAIPAAADVIMELRRLQTDHQSAERSITTYSRFSETPQEFVIELTPDGYITKGSKRDVLFEKKLEKVLMRLKDYPEGITASELHEAWSKEEKAPTERTIRNHINALEAQKRVRQCGEKIVGKNKTAVWIACAENMHDATIPDG